MAVMDMFSSWRVRIISSFGVAILIFTAFTLISGYKPDEIIKQQIAGVQNSQSSLQSTADAIKSLSQPDEITPQSLSAARDYTRQLLTAAPSIANDASLPEPLRNIFQNKKIRSYNQVISDPEFIKAHEAATDQLELAKQLLDYQVAVMSALQNLIEYQPTQDTSRPDATQTLEAVLLAGGGLEKTAARLEALPDFTDEYLQEIMTLLTDIEVARKAYETSLESRQAVPAQRTAYITAFTSAQTKLLANRTAFWLKMSEDSVLGLENAHRELRPFVTRLTNL